MEPTQWIFEGIKLALQLGGAGFVGWLGVRWALRRYKSEKTWEKRLTLYSDIVSSITEMQRVLDQFDDAEGTRRVIPEAERIELMREYGHALKATLASRGQTEILLNSDVFGILNKLPTELSNASYRANSWFDDVQDRWAVLRDAKASIVTMAKRDLGIS